MQFSQILTDHIGELGRFQIITICLLFILRFPSVIHNMGYVFFAATPPHWCRYPHYNITAGLSEDHRKLLYIPSQIVAGEREFSR